MSTPVLELRGLRVDYVTRRHWWSRTPGTVLRAVDGVDLALARGASYGLVGESGCGKSTLARTVVGLQEPAAGSIAFEGARIDSPRPAWVPRHIQIAFQDPYSSLNPRMTVSQTLGEMLHVHEVVPQQQVDARIDELLGLVGLGGSVRDAYPRQLSGGQRQRVGIARALSLEPDVLIADEPVSALDVSVQATILALLAELRERLGLTLLLIAHDLAVVRQVCDEVAVMYLGRIVERGPISEVFARPRHPYTQALLRAVPSLRPGSSREHVAVPGEPPSPYAIPAGCRFNPRCPIARQRCQRDDPTLHPGDGAVPEHLAACHLAWRAPVDDDGAAIHAVTDQHEEKAP